MGTGIVKRAASALLVILASLLTPQLACAQYLKPGATALFVGDPGDYVGQGQTLFFREIFSYNTYGAITVNMVSPNHDYTLTLRPGYGRDFEVGIFEGATSRSGYQDPRPYISFSGDGRGCTATGRFVIRQIAPPNTDPYLNLLDLSFEQRCEDTPNATLWGEVRIGVPPLDPPPPAPPLTATIELDDVAFISGRGSDVVTIGGSLSCSRYANANVMITGTAVQKTPGKTLGNSNFSFPVYCSTEPKNWTYQFSSDGVIPFHQGRVDVELVGRLVDPDTGNETTTQVQGTPTLVAP